MKRIVLSHCLRHRIRRLLFSVAFGIVTSSIIGGCTPVAVKTETRDLKPADVVDDRELVVLIDEALPTALLKTSAAQRGYRLRDESLLSALKLRMLTFEIPDGTSGPEAIAEIEAIEPAATAGVNHAFRPPQSGAKIDPLNYADQLLPWPEGGCVASVPVGLIDTAVDVESDSLADAHFIVNSFTQENNAEVRTDTRHGTDVAAIIAAPHRIKQLTIYSAAVVDATPVGEAAGVDAIIKAVGWLLENNVRVINFSLAGPYNKILDRGLSAAADRGAIFVAAVGNDGADAPPLYPAAFDYALAVTAIDAETNIYEQAVRGEHVDIAAPGVDIFVADAQKSRFATGTSIAAPFVTARIAGDPALSRARSISDVMNLLKNNAVDLGEPGVDAVFGAGLVSPPTHC